MTYTAKTHCKNGHEYTPDNTSLRKGGIRRCLTCARAAARRFYSTPERRQQKRDYFDRWKTTEGGKAAYKKAKLKKRGFTPELFDFLAVEQGGKCAICGNQLSENKRNWFADHCHETGAPRGIVCPPCNSLEGFIRTSGLTIQDYMARLSSYIANPPATKFTG